MSEVKHDVNARVDEWLDLTVRRFVYYSVAGFLGGRLLFRSRANRWAAVAFGAGIGIGSAYTKCSQKFDTRTASPSQTPTSQGARD